MKSLFFALVCSLALAACGVAPVQPPVMNTQTVTVKEQVPVPCVDSIPAAPAFLSDNELLTGSGKRVADQIWIDHIQRRDYIGELTAVLLKCQTVPAAPAPASTSKLSGPPIS